MAKTFNKINDFVEAIAHKVHDLDNDQLMVALSNTAPDAETNDPSENGNGVLANVTEIDYTNLDGANPRNLTKTSSEQTGGTYKLVIADLTLTASGGSVGPFRYIYIYNSTPAGDNLIGYYDYESALTLADGESLVLDFHDTNGVLTLV